MTNEKGTTESTPLPLPCDALGMSDVKKIKDQLRQCKTQIDKDQTQVNNRKNRTSKLEADIASFDKASGQIDQLYEEYKKAHENLEKDKILITKEYDCWNTSLPTSPEDRKLVDDVAKIIDGQITDFNKEIEKLEKCEGGLDLNGSILYAEVEYKKAQFIFKNSEKIFEESKNRLKKINENIKKGKDSSKAIQDELNKLSENGEQNKKYERNAYFYFKELAASKVWLVSWIKSPDVFKRELKTALEVMGNSKIVLNDNEGKLNEWKALLEDDKKKLEAAEKSRNKDILDRLNEIPVAIPEPIPEPE